MNGGSKPNGLGIVLSRQRDERILIGDPPFLAITVVDIRGDKVRLAFKTHGPTLPINREEVYVGKELKKNGRSSC